MELNEPALCLKRWRRNLKEMREVVAGPTDCCRIPVEDPGNYTAPSFRGGSGSQKETGRVRRGPKDGQRDGQDR